MIKQKQKNHSPVSDAFRFADYFGGTFSFLGAVSFRWTVCGGGLSGSIMWTWFRFPKVWTLRQHSFFTLLFVKLPLSLGNFQVGLNVLNHFFIAILLKLSYALLTRPTQICYTDLFLEPWSSQMDTRLSKHERRFCTKVPLLSAWYVRNVGEQLSDDMTEVSHRDASHMTCVQEE